MRLTWSRRRHAPVPAVDRLHFVIWDFLRMLAGAVISGFVISLAAAGVTLVLAGRADAAVVDPSHASPAGPGVLLVGLGCDSTPLQARERDWLVKVDGGRATIRVMQTFLLPAEEDMAAVFTAVLPPRARLISLQSQTTRRDEDATVLSEKRHDALDAEEYRLATANAVLVRVSAEGEFITSPLPGLEGDQAITLTYTYSIPVDVSRDRHGFDLPLTEDPRLSGDDVGISPAANDPREQVGGAVWVEWTGRKPRKLDSVPSEAQIDRDHSSIRGLSWESPGLSPISRFRLAWQY